MSAYFVTPETISDAAYAIKFDTAYDPYEGLSVRQLGVLLYQLNALAMFERYEEDMETNFAAIIEYAKNPATPSSDRFQRFKSLECLTYQLSEGDVPDTKLFKDAVAAEDEIEVNLTGSHGSVYAVPQYEQAAWNRER